VSVEVVAFAENPLVFFITQRKTKNSVLNDCISQNCI